MPTVFIFVSFEEKGCYRIVSLGHENFDCRSYCGLSRRMQGRTSRFKFVVVKIIGRVYSLKLILYGTREDPLTNNRHVDRRKKRWTKFTKDQIENRRKGQL